MHGRESKRVQYGATVMFKVTKLAAPEPLADAKQLPCMEMKKGHLLRGRVAFYRGPITIPGERTLIRSRECV